MSDTALQWKSFSFFTLSPNSKPFPIETTAEEILCVCAGRSTAHFADSTGQIISLFHSPTYNDRTTSASIKEEQLNNLGVVVTRAYDKLCTHLVALKGRRVLVTVGYDDDELCPLLKIWTVSENPDENLETKALECKRVIKVATSDQFGSSSSSSGVSCLSLVELASSSSDRQQHCALALGLENGCCVVFRGDLLADRYLRQRVLHEEYRDKGSITGLGLDRMGEFLYVCTEYSVTGYSLSPALDNIRRCFHSEEDGARPRCSTILSQNLSSSLQNSMDEFVVAKAEAVYLYGREGRGPCFILDDYKRAVLSYRNYLLVIGKQQSKQQQSSSSFSSKVGLIIYDLRSKIIAFSHYFADTDVVDVFYEWGSYYILTSDKKLYRLVEKSTGEKLEALYRKDLYQLALNVAISSGLDEDSISNIYYQFGDYLFRKGDYDAAVEQYIQTLGHHTPSDIILKFLDFSRTSNLVSYLEALHGKDLATIDHTTLLLNCYAKTKDSQKLNDFIRNDKQFSFDVNNAIRICRSCGFFDEALFLAEKHSRHALCVDILLEDMKSHERAIAYISKLGHRDAERAMKQYGRTLLKHLPEQTTGLLLRLCTGDFEGSSIGVAGDKRKSNVDDFMATFLNHDHWLMVFLEQLIAKEPQCESVVVWNTLLELYLSRSIGNNNGEITDDDNDTDNQEDPQLIVEMGNKAIELMKNPLARYDTDQAMILCELNQFRPGILYLLEKQELYRDILEYHMDHGEYRQVLAACKKYARGDESLWLQVLKYFSEQTTTDCQDEIREVLGEIDRLRLAIPPLKVLEVLSRNPNTKFGLVKDYLLREIEEREEEIKRNEEQISAYREQISKVQQHLDELESGTVVIQNTKCTACNFPLEVPMVHFLCKHSYHIRCMGENEKECPKCAPQFNQILEEMIQMDLASNQHDHFFKDLASAENGMDVVADYLSRNVFLRCSSAADKKKSR